MTSTVNGDLVLEIPAVPAYLLTARLFIGSVARHFNVEEPTVEDLKLAASEACTAAVRNIEDSGGTGPIRLVARHDGETLSLQVDDAVAPGETALARGTTDDLVRSLGLEVVQALFPEMEVLDPEHGSSSPLRVRVPAPTRGV